MAVDAEREHQQAGIEDMEMAQAVSQVKEAIQVRQEIKEMVVIINHQEVTVVKVARLPQVVSKDRQVGNEVGGLTNRLTINILTSVQVAQVEVMVLLKVQQVALHQATQVKLVK